MKEWCRKRAPQIFLKRMTSALVGNKSGSGETRT
jgi:hypothetical protein